MKHKHNTEISQRGLGHVAVLLLIIVIVAVGLVGWKVMSGKDGDIYKASNKTSSSSETSNAPSELIWQQIDKGWRSMQTPPTCPAQPMLVSPVDLSKVTSILYPGQTRGGNYKPHGGFRLDNTKNADVTVTAPIDGFIVRGGRYLAEGEVQYTFDMMNNCGVMYRVGHFRALPDNLQKLADTWPAPKDGDSRTQAVNPAVYVARGEILATSVGIIGSNNTFFDWGVFDYRQENEASKSAAYKQKHAQEEELAWHAVCWFDWLPAKDEARIRSLSAGDPTSAKMSDYCQ